MKAAFCKIFKVKIQVTLLMCLNFVSLLENWKEAASNEVNWRIVQPESSGNC